MDLIQSRSVAGSGILVSDRLRQLQLKAATMTKSGLLTIILTLGLAACSGDDTPTAGTGGGN